MQEITTCSDDKTEKCYLEHISKHNFPNCSKTCMPVTMKGFPKCKIINDYVCNFYPMWDTIFTNSFKKCPKHCDWVEYHGAKLTSYYNSDNSKWKYFHYWWSYHFDNELIEVQEEYLMYDIIGLIGTIGGTLGLFVGFSFLDLSSTFMHFFASWINHD